MPSAILLLSSERSGSNLIRTIFDSHPDICAPSPPHLIKTFLPIMSLYGDLSVPDNLRRVVSDTCKVLENQLGTWKWKPNRDSLIELVEDSTFKSIILSVYNAEALLREKSRVFIKDNGIINYPFHAHAMFNDAKYIYLVRDVRDVVVSWKKSRSHVGTMKHAAQVWADEQRRALNFYSLLAGTGAIKIVFYEDLVSEPEFVLQEICDFLGVMFSKEMLAFHQSDEAKRSATAVKDWENLSSPIIST